MRLTRRQLVAGTPLLSACGTPSSPVRRRDRPPNVVVLFPDQWRADVVAAYGHPLVRTPNLDRLVRESTSFSAAFTVSPLCQPARIAMMTQRYPSETGTHDNFSDVDPSWPSHVRRLRDEAGYACHLVGKAHVTDGTFDRPTEDTLADLLEWGFTSAVEVPGDRTASKVDNAYRQELRDRDLEGRWLAWMADYERFAWRRSEWETRPLSTEGYELGEDATIDRFVADRAIELLRDSPDRPFYLQVNFPGPHPPWNAPVTGDEYDPDDPRLPLGNLVDPGQPWSQLVELSREELAPPPSEVEARIVSALYLQRLTLVDRQIGRVLDVLEETGRLDDTFVIFASDHGEMLGEKNLLGKVVMFRPSTRIPLLVRPPGGATPTTSNAWTELVDLPATVLHLAGLEPGEGDRGRSLVPVLAGATTEHRTEVVAECMGFSAVRTPEALLVVDDTGEDAEYYDLVADPDELENRVGDPATAAARDTLRAKLAERLG